MLALVDADRGAHFELTWPTLLSETKPPSAKVISPAGLAGARILVVEDDHAVIDLLDIALSARGASVVTVRRKSELEKALAEGPFSAALFVQGVVGIGVSVPSSPGFFGVFELAATIGLAVYGVPRELAVSWALGYHILSFIPITVFGAVYFTRLGLNLTAVTRAKEAAA